MPECYLCGTYIKRGAGYRREVKTGRSVRVYATKRGGASFGSSFSTRTVCRLCAKILDRTSEGWFFRSILFCLGWALCAWLGWRMVVTGSGYADLMGLSFLLGLPVVAAGAVLGHFRQRRIERDVRADMRKGSSRDLGVGNIPGVMLHQEMPQQSHRVRSDRSAAMPDLSAEKERNSQSCDENAETRHPVDEEHVFYSHDSIQSWARRVGDQLGKRAGKSKEELRDFLVQMAKVTRPRVGEGTHRFNARAQERLGSIDRTLDPTSPETALRHGEDLNSWLMRYVPLCLVVEDGKSLDDLIPKLAEAAQFRPPRMGESAASWIGNVYQFLD